MSGEINLGQIAGKDGKYRLHVSNETPEDAQARRLQEAADATLKRWMTLGVFAFALVFTTVVFLGCAYLFINGAAEDQKWAAGILSAIASGLVGFLVGQGRR